MKTKIFFTLLVLAVYLAGCKEPLSDDDLDSVVAVKNNSPFICTVRIIVGPDAVMTDIRNVAPGEEWCYSSMFFGEYTVQILNRTSLKLVNETPVLVPSADDKKAAVVEWDGNDFKTYTRRR